MNKTHLKQVIFFVILIVATLIITKPSYAALVSVDLGYAVSSTTEQGDAKATVEGADDDQISDLNSAKDSFSGFSIHGNFLFIGLALDSHEINEYFGDSSNVALSDSNYSIKNKSTVTGYSLLFNVPFVPIVDITLGLGAATRKYESTLEPTLASQFEKTGDSNVTANMITYQLKVVYPIKIAKVFELRVGAGYQAFTGSKVTQKFAISGSGDILYNLELNPNYSVINLFIGAGF